MQKFLGKRGGLVPAALCAALSLTALTALVAPAAHAQNYVGQVIANGLLNPRGLTFGPDGALYVAEAGSGGNGPSILGAAGETVSYGATSGLTRIANGVQTRLISDLPSLAPQAAPTPGGSATGLHKLAFAADGSLYGTIGFVNDPALRADLTAAGAPGGNFGRLVRFNLGGTPTAEYLNDLSAFETANNPDAPELNSNPYGIAAVGDGLGITDAGGNYLLGLTPDGAGGFNESLRATFPAVPNPIFDPANPATGGPTYQAVPTGVTEGAGGTLYVSELTGYPFVVGAANIFTISPGGAVGVVPGGGFTNLIDVTYSPLTGNLYALQLDTNGLGPIPGPNPGPGQLIQVNPTTGERTTIYSGLQFPGGVAVGNDGAFYVTNLSVAAGGGQVLRIVAAPEPGSLGLIAGALLVAGMSLVRRRA